MDCWREIFTGYHPATSVTSEHWKKKQNKRIVRARTSAKAADPAIFF